MAMYDFRKLIELYPHGTAVAIEVNEPGRIQLDAFTSAGSFLIMTLSPGDAGAIYDALGAAIKTAEGLTVSEERAEAITDGLAELRARKAADALTGVTPDEPPC